MWYWSTALGRSRYPTILVQISNPLAQPCTRRNPAMQKEQWTFPLGGATLTPYPASPIDSGNPAMPLGNGRDGRGTTSPGSNVWCGHRSGRVELFEQRVARALGACRL